MHEIQNGLQALHAQFRVAQAIDQSCRVANVCEQNGETLALSALGIERPQDMLPGLVCRPASLVERGAALAAIAGGRPVEVSAGFALYSEGGPASFAIFIGRLVLTTTTQTLPIAPWIARAGDRTFKVIYSAI